MFPSNQSKVSETSWASRQMRWRKVRDCGRINKAKGHTRGEGGDRNA